MTEDASSWTRPDTVPFPTIWRKYEGILEMSDGKKPRFVIQDLTEDLLDDTIHLMTTVFCKDEPMMRELKMTEDPVSMDEIRASYIRISHDKLALVALLDDGSAKPRVVGANMMFVRRKQDKFCIDNYKGKGLRRLAADCFGYAMSSIDVFEYYGVQEHLCEFGLVVHPDFRGQGLGVEIVRAWDDICTAVGLKTVMTFFTSFGGQKSAERAGLDFVTEIPYNVFKTDDGQEIYSGIEPKSMKLMGKIFF